MILLVHSFKLCVLQTKKDDHSRVELKKDPEVGGSDYINASFINVSYLELFNIKLQLLPVTFIPGLS